MALLIPLLAVAITGVGLLLALVSALAAARTRSVRFTFAAGAFLVLAVRGGLVLLDGAGLAQSPMPWNGWSVGLDALVLAFLYMAIVKG